MAKGRIVCIILTRTLRNVFYRAFLTYDFSLGFWKFGFYIRLFAKGAGYSAVGWLFDGAFIYYKFTI